MVAWKDLDIVAIEPLFPPCFLAPASKQLIHMYLCGVNSIQGSNIELGTFGLPHPAAYQQHKYQHKSLEVPKGGIYLKSDADFSLVSLRT